MAVRTAKKDVVLSFPQQKDNCDLHFHSAAKIRRKLRTLSHWHKNVNNQTITPLILCSLCCQYIASLISWAASSWFLCLVPTNKHSPCSGGNTGTKKCSSSSGEGPVQEPDLGAASVSMCNRLYILSKIKIAKSGIEQYPWLFQSLDQKVILTSGRRWTLNWTLSSWLTNFKIWSNVWADHHILCFASSVDLFLPLSDFCFSQDIYSSPHHTCLKAKHSVYWNEE